MYLKINHIDGTHRVIAIAQEFFTPVKEKRGKYVQVVTVEDKVRSLMSDFNGISALLFKDEMNKQIFV